MAAKAASGAHALACLRPVPNDRLEIRDDPAKGRGVFARQPIPGGTLIEAAPVIIVPAEQCPLLDRTILHDYYFQWDNFDRSGAAQCRWGWSRCAIIRAGRMRGCGATWHRTHSIWLRRHRLPPETR